MIKPIMDNNNQSRSTINQFGGYNHNILPNENEFYDMKNLTSDNYPILSPRGKRGTYLSGGNYNGIVAQDKLCYVDGRYFVCGNKRYDLDLTGTPKQLITMGAYVIIMPDKKYINTIIPYEEVKERPYNWNETYFNYYIENENVFSKIPFGVSRANILTEKPDYWESNYTSYYINKNGKYVKIPYDDDYNLNNPYPFDYYDALDIMPSDWDTNYKSYYEKDGENYTKILEVAEPPKFISGKYYKKRERFFETIPDFNTFNKVYKSNFGSIDAGFEFGNNNGFEYKYLGELAPEDWNDNYTKYYKRTGSFENYTYSLLSLEEYPTAPTYTEKTYFSASVGKYAEFSLCDKNGKDYYIRFNRDDPTGEQLVDGDLWLNEDENGDVILKRYSSELSMWSNVLDVNTKIRNYGIDLNFKEGDFISFKGLDKEIYDNRDGHQKKVKNTLVDNTPYKIIKISQYEGEYPVWDTIDTRDYIVIQAIISCLPNTYSHLTQKYNYYLQIDDSQKPNLKIERYMPKMDFVFESGNRLWGCRYGLNNDNIFVNEIYASKQGDFTNWNSFDGTSLDSYVASCGTDGAWTGAISFFGNPLFFKENYMHKVYGSYPAQYQIQATKCRGVQKGFADTLKIVNEALFYKSRNGICVYDGSLPQKISAPFGMNKYRGIDSNNTDELRNGGVAGSYDNKYYINLKSDEDKKWYLFVYDTEKGLWHKEDEIKLFQFCEYKDDIYAINDTKEKIMCLLGSTDKDASAVEWMAETGIIEATSPNKKYIQRLIINLLLEVGSVINVFIEYDSSGVWEHITTQTGTKLKSVSLPIRTRRCNHFRMKIEGKGDAKIFSISKDIEQGSDL